MARFAMARAVFIHFLYIAFSVAIFIRLGEILQHESTYKKGSTIAAGVVLNVVHLAIQIFLLQFYIRRYKDYSNGDEDKDHPSWVNIPMLVFIMFNIGPYGMAMHYQYKQLNPALTTSRNNSTLHQYQQLNNSASLKDSPLSCSAVPKIPNFSFYLFHGGPALLVLAHMLYPYPQRTSKPNENLAIAIELLNVYDIMDMVENITCFQTYSAFLLGLFYMSLMISALHVAFPISLSEEDDRDPKKGRILSSIITLVFTDIMFAILRLCVMIYGKDAQLGFNFFSKNVMAAICRFFLIGKTIFP